MLLDNCMLTYHFWFFDWYQCQKMSACGLGRPDQALSGPLSRRSVSGAAVSRNSYGGAGHQPRSAHCCGWSCGNHIYYAAPGCRWPGTQARHHTPLHQSPQHQAGGRWGRETLWGRCLAQEWRQTRASQPARTPKELQSKRQKRKNLGIQKRLVVYFKGKINL